MWSVGDTLHVLTSCGFLNAAHFAPVRNEEADAAFVHASHGPHATPRSHGVLSCILELTAFCCRGHGDMDISCVGPASDQLQYRQHASFGSVQCSCPPRKRLLTGCHCLAAADSRCSEAGSATGGAGGEYRCASAYPSPGRSMKLGRQNLHLFRLKNTRFDVIGGLVYFFLVVRRQLRSRTTCRLCDCLQGNTRHLTLFLIAQGHRADFLSDKFHMQLLMFHRLNRHQ